MASWPQSSWRTVLPVTKSLQIRFIGDAFAVVVCDFAR